MSSAADIIHAVYDDAIFVGIRPPEFWELSYGEIRACIRAYNRREKQRGEEEKIKQKSLITIAYRTSALISAMVWNPKKAPTIEKAFPEWFGEEERGQESVPLWKRQQAGMAGYFAAYNAALKARNGGVQHG